MIKTDYTHGKRSISTQVHQCEFCGERFPGPDLWLTTDRDVACNACMAFVEVYKDGNVGPAGTVAFVRAAKEVGVDLALLVAAAKRDGVSVEVSL